MNFGVAKHMLRRATPMIIDISWALNAENVEGTFQSGSYPPGTQNGLWYNLNADVEGYPFGINNNASYITFITEGVTNTIVNQAPTPNTTVTYSRARASILPGNYIFTLQGTVSAGTDFVSWEIRDSTSSDGDTDPDLVGTRVIGIDNIFNRTANVNVSQTVNISNGYLRFAVRPQAAGSTYGGNITLTIQKVIS